MRAFKGDETDREKKRRHKQTQVQRGTAAVTDGLTGGRGTENAETGRERERGRDERSPKKGCSQKKEDMKNMKEEELIDRERDAKKAQDTERERERECEERKKDRKKERKNERKKEPKKEKTKERKIEIKTMALKLKRLIFL